MYDQLPELFAVNCGATVTGEVLIDKVIVAFAKLAPEITGRRVVTVVPFAGEVMVVTFCGEAEGLGLGVGFGPPVPGVAEGLGDGDASGVADGEGLGLTPGLVEGEGLADMTPIVTCARVVPLKTFGLSPGSPAAET